MKPPYRVPSMAEIAKTNPNGYTVVSTFSGCGGSCLGFRMAGFRVAWANEFVEAARETYALNNPSTWLSADDIRKVTGAQVRKTTGRREFDVLEGSPPCASFSTAGKREQHWGQVKKYSDTEQRTDDLFFEYARLVRELTPKVFVAENVSGLVKGTAKGTFIEILTTLKKAGYRVVAKTLDAQWLGVPQARQRVIFIGVREDLDIEPRFPKPMPYFYSIVDACPWIKSVKADRLTSKAGARSGEIVRVNVRKPVATITANGVGNDVKYDWTVDGDAPSLEGYAIGEEWDNLRPGQTSEKYFNLVRPHPDKPCPTITQLGGSNPGVAGVTHPSEKRKFSIAELKRLCSFPDDFVLTGTYSQQWERLGRAVPPLMMKAVAEKVKEVLDANRR